MEHTYSEPETVSRRRRRGAFEKATARKPLPDTLFLKANVCSKRFARILSGTFHSESFIAVYATPLEDSHCVNVQHCALSESGRIRKIRKDLKSFSDLQLQLLTPRQTASRLSRSISFANKVAISKTQLFY